MNPLTTCGRLLTRKDFEPKMLVSRVLKCEIILNITWIHSSYLNIIIN